jgi:hypothetical protein
MIDLTDFGYVSARVQLLDPGGSVAGTLGGPSDYIMRPGARFAVTYQLPELGSSDDARKFQALLEQGGQDDVSYPWPLDYRPPTASLGGVAPRVNGSSPPGASLPIKNLVPGYSFRLGQPLAVISGGSGYIHRIASPVVVNNTGAITAPIFPWTRASFVDNDLVEIERPRIRGILSWDGSSQGSYGKRGFNFTITERR